MPPDSAWVRLELQPCLRWGLGLGRRVGEVLGGGRVLEYSSRSSLNVEVALGAPPAALAPILGTAAAAGKLGKRK